MHVGESARELYVWRTRMLGGAYGSPATGNHPTHRKPNRVQQMHEDHTTYPRLPIYGKIEAAVAPYVASTGWEVLL